MSYSLKNKTIALIALAFTVMMVIPCTGHAQAAPAAAAPTPISEDIDIFGLDEEEANTPVVQNAAVAEENKLDSEVKTSTPEAPKAAENKTNTSTSEPTNENTTETPAGSENLDDFLDDVNENNDIASNETTTTDVEKKATDAVTSDSAEKATSNSAKQSQPANDELLNDVAPVKSDADAAQSQSNDKDTNSKAEAIPAAEAPKSPFESFGNAILARVDNDLFNQMSDIEKQTTLLNLELKREELNNKVEALKAARKRAQDEEIARRKELEEKMKDREAQRQALIIAEQEKLRQREIELEKVRQARVLNEYMNEMLVINQKWVEKNASLQARIKELEQERIDLIKNFEKQAGDVHREISSVKKHADAALSTHERVITSMNAQITQLRRSLVENEERYKRLRDGNLENPFAANGLDENAVDMSKEYAIMDITGKGDNIVAKIVNREGATFIVHKGSMLKGGEVVTAIDDNYIAFENKGVKSYLYTGGTIVEFEPTVSFNDSEKMPEETEKSSIKSETRNVRGQSTNKSNAVQQQNRSQNTRERTPQNTRSTRRRNSTSVASGMFVK